MSKALGFVDFVWIIYSCLWSSKNCCLDYVIFENNSEFGIRKGSVCAGELYQFLKILPKEVSVNVVRQHY